MMKTKYVAYMESVKSKRRYAVAALIDDCDTEKEIANWIKVLTATKDIKILSIQERPVRRKPWRD